MEIRRLYDIFNLYKNEYVEIYDTFLCKEFISISLEVIIINGMRKLININYGKD
jgi:hypothetical protein